MADEAAETNKPVADTGLDRSLAEGGAASVAAPALDPAFTNPVEAPLTQAGNEAPALAPGPADAAEMEAAEPLIRFPHARPWLENLRWTMSVLLIVFFIRAFIGEATIIPTGSMENTILVGDHVFLNKLYYGPRIPFTSWRLPALKSVRRGQIIAFRYPRDPQMIYVKRVIGLPGERVEIRHNRVFVDDTPLDEPYTLFTNRGLRENFGPRTIPADHYFVMGDNRDNSYDSRFWGDVPAGNIVGEPVMVYWSYEAPSEAWLGEGFQNRVQFYASVARNFFSKTRWSRTGLVF